MTRLAVALVALLLVCVPTVPAGATGASPEEGAKEVIVFFRSPTNPKSVFQLEVFPERGVAVVTTFEGVADLSGGAVAYAIAIPPASFDGSLNLDFPGLGTIVGTVTRDDPAGPAAQEKLCESNFPSEGAKFDGHLAFHGAGGYARWSTSEAPARIAPDCGAEPERENGPDDLFRHASEFGPVLDGPARIRFFAKGEVRHRIVEFIAWAGAHGSSTVEFDAVDREWLPGQIATVRWAKRTGVSLEKTVSIRGEATKPASVTFTPPGPYFFGKGIYRRRTGKLAGSLGARFLGLKLHLTPSPLPATFIDEVP